MHTFLMMMSGGLIGVGAVLLLGWRPRGKRWATVHAQHGWLGAANAVRQMAWHLAKQGEPERADVLFKAASALTAAHFTTINGGEKEEVD